MACVWRRHKGYISKTFSQQSCFKNMSIQSCGTKSILVFLDKKNNTHILPSLSETSTAPKNRSSQKESSIPTIHFQGLCLFQGGCQIENIHVTCHVPCTKKNNHPCCSRVVPKKSPVFFSPFFGRRQKCFPLSPNHTRRMWEGVASVANHDLKLSKVALSWKLEQQKQCCAKLPRCGYQSRQKLPNNWFGIL